jgi:hypothetical protein
MEKIITKIKPDRQNIKNYMQRIMHENGMSGDNCGTTATNEQTVSMRADDSEATVTANLRSPRIAGTASKIPVRAKVAKSSSKYVPASKMRLSDVVRLNIFF